jgi:uncharacterized membrane protein
MNPVDIIIVVVIATIVGLAGWYIYKSKKKRIDIIVCDTWWNNMNFALLIFIYIICHNFYFTHLYIFNYDIFGE